MPTAKPGLSPARLKTVIRAEEAALHARTPRSAAWRARAAHSMPNGVPMTWMQGLYPHLPIVVASGLGARFTDLDGNEYLDFNLVDLALTIGFGPGPVAAAVSAAMQQGAHFLLPIEAAADVTETLAARTGLPFWQFTLSASGANAEAIRIARAWTDRDKILVFEGHYHGHIEATLAERDGAAVRAVLQGLPRDAARATVIIDFNDLDAAAAALSRRDIALVLTEPALTNCTLVEPVPGYLATLYALCREHGTLLALDEAHTVQFAYGGLKRAWQLDCDLLILGKGLGSGVPFGLYGLSAELGEFVAQRSDSDFGASGLALGGTTYANTLAILAARAALAEVLTESNHARVSALGQHLRQGLQSLFDVEGMPWRATGIGPRVSYCLFPDPPRNGREGRASIDREFIRARRLWLANRGIWDAIATAGPQVSFAHVQSDLDAYLTAVAPFLAASHD